MFADRIWKGDYINETPVKKGEWDTITLLFFEGKEGKCYASLIRENELSFKPEWYPISLRGYHKGADIPENFKIEMKNPIQRWVRRIPENGAFGLSDTEKDRNTRIGE